MAVFDAFQFFDELELLDIRLHELSPVVDKFVLLESPITFTGHSKPLYYEENKKLFSEFEDKIIHIVVYDTPISTEDCKKSISDADKLWLGNTYQLEDAWIRERFQRNALMRYLQWAEPNDIIILSDADEIVRASIVGQLEEIIVDGSNAVEQRLNSYYLNLRCTNMPWWGSKIIRRKFMPSSMSELRFHTPASKLIYNGGWHFTFFGGIERIQKKVKSFSHTEFDNPDILNPDNINYRLAHHLDVLGRLYEYEEIPMDDLPKYVLDNLDKFDKFIYKANK